MRSAPVLAASILALMACGDDSSGQAQDGAPPDAPVNDGGLDAGPDAALPDASTIDDPMFTNLSQIGMYSDFDNKVLDSALLMFEPAYLLWSDEAIKRRWIYLPPGTKIDTSDMDNWRFPIGTKIFKQFSYQPDVGDEIILETRLVMRLDTADTAEAWWGGSFAWYGEGVDPEVGSPLADPELVTADRSTPVPDRTEDHIVPRQSACAGCHNGSSHKYLGFQAVQLTHDKEVGGLTVNTDYLWANNLLTHQPQDKGYPVPGDATAQAALGYLHANCAHCHVPPELRASLAPCYDNTSGDGIPNAAFRLRTTDTTVETTLTYTSMVNQTVKIPGNAGDLTTRIIPGDAANSEVHFRMDVLRGDNQQMPPFAGGYNQIIHTEGVTTVETWINSLTP